MSIYDSYSKYNRVSTSLLRPYRDGEPMGGVSISAADTANGSPRVGDMIAINPENSTDRWLIAEAYFLANFVPAEV